MTVEEIEIAEAVSDPLGAVPPLPFGHLNAAWSRFKSGLVQGDTIWRFAAQWDGEWGTPEIREGYVIARGDGFGPYFLDGAAHRGAAGGRRDWGNRVMKGRQSRLPRTVSSETRVSVMHSQSIVRR